MMMASQPHVVLHCNAGSEYGMGHLMRCLTLGVEAERQGWRVSILGDLSSDATALAQRMTASAEIINLSRDSAPETAASLLSDLNPDLIHIDSYWPESDVLASFDGTVISNMQDGPFGTRPATIAIDANLGAEFAFVDPDLSSHQLAGASVTAIRESVRAQRESTTIPSETLRVLVVLGGTDPYGITPRVIENLGSLSSPWQVTAIAPAAVRTAVKAAAAQQSTHEISVIGFSDDLPALAREHDVVITAAGTSVWDFACMGIPMGLVCVTENQQPGFEAAISAGIGVAVSTPPHAAMAVGLKQFESAVSVEKTRAELIDRGKELVDGLGAWRIVSSWGAVMTTAREARSAERTEMTARPAVMEDARMLFDWRNDEVTRQASRSSAPLIYDNHVEWVRTVLNNPDRILLVIEDGENSVGTVRWDHLTGIDWEVSIALSPAYRGKGIGLDVLRAGEAALLRGEQTVRMIAAIHEGNGASERLFKRANYLPHLPVNEESFNTFAKLCL